MSINKRREPRLRYRSHGTITDGNNKWPAHIVNLSNNGALIAVICDHLLQENSSISLQVEMLDGKSVLMHGHVVHIQEHYLGLHCKPNGKAGQERLAKALDGQNKEEDNNKNSDENTE